MTPARYLRLTLPRYLRNQIANEWRLARRFDPVQARELWREMRDETLRQARFAMDQYPVEIH